MVPLHTDHLCRRVSIHKSILNSGDLVEITRCERSHFISVVNRQTSQPIQLKEEGEERRGEERRGEERRGEERRGEERRGEERRPSHNIHS